MSFAIVQVVTLLLEMGQVASLSMAELSKTRTSNVSCLYIV